MTPYRNTARVVGALFIAGSLAGVLSVGFQAPATGDDYLARAAAGSDRVATGALLELAMGAALLGVAVALYPVLRRCSERLALGYVAARAVEAVCYVVDVALLLVLVTASRDAAGASAADAGTLQVAGDLVRGARDWVGGAILPASAFGLSAVILNVTLYRGGFVPRWLSAWGIAGALPYLAAGVMVTYGLEPFSATQNALDAPLALQEIALALWLLVRGFNADAFAPRAAVARRAAA